ncbi:MAG: class I mannose-6-phosphate isomerase [Phycisphaerales bacterium]|nr:class I mannose-6-phosphate isomerase [Phycisphaerales bacterium]
MSIYNNPWKLEWNKLHDYPGGREIDRFRGIAPPIDDGHPEAWIGSDTRMLCPPRDNPDAGFAKVILPGRGGGEKKYLFEVIQESPDKVLGSAHRKVSGNKLGVLMKLLDAEKQLGLQCHPNGSNAKKYYNSDYGKAESWYIIGTRTDTPEPAYVYMGFKEGITKEQYAKAFDIAAQTGDVSAMTACCHKIPVKAGDVFNIAPGLPHAIGAGCFLVEVQEPSDITVDWVALSTFYPEPVRKLHREIVLDCFEYNGHSLGETISKYHVEPEVLREGLDGREVLLIGKKHTPCFSFSQLETNSEMKTIYTGFPRVMLMLEGSGTMKWDGGEMKVKKADEFFVPFGVKDLSFSTDGGTLKVVICNPPTDVYH